jgi:predicted Zn finger-like uncharacterized protein
MKLVCDFCKTEYTLNKKPVGAVRCAVCGHVWTPRVQISQNTLLKFIAAFCALLAACVFSFVVIMNFYSGENKPLIPKIDEKNIHIISDENGNNRISVTGSITNTTNEIYGLPNIIIVSYDSENNVLSRQNFVPPVTLLEAKDTAEFNYVLSVNPVNVKRLSVELKE